MIVFANKIRFNGLDFERKHCQLWMVSLNASNTYSLFYLRNHDKDDLWWIADGTIKEHTPYENEVIIERLTNSIVLSTDTLDRLVQVLRALESPWHLQALKHDDRIAAYIITGYGTGGRGMIESMHHMEIEK